MRTINNTFAEYVAQRDRELNEVGTSTANVAQFRQMVIPSTVRRQWPDTTDEFFKKRQAKADKE